MRHDWPEGNRRATAHEQRHPLQRRLDRRVTLVELAGVPVPPATLDTGQTHVPRRRALLDDRRDQQRRPEEKAGVLLPESWV